MKRTIAFSIAVVLSMASPAVSQGVKELSKDGIAHGNIFLFEGYSDSSDMHSKLDLFKEARITLKNGTTGGVLDVRDTAGVDTANKTLYVKFHGTVVKALRSCQLIMFVNDTLYASSDSMGESGSSAPLQVDIQPSFDLTKDQELDLNWSRNLTAVSLGSFAGNTQLNARGKFSTKPDSGALNSVQWSVGYRVIWGNGGLFKYVALSGQAGGQHPQDFSQTDLVGSVALSSILPWTDILCRAVTGNWTDASVGLVVQPAAELVNRMTRSDSSYVRGAIHASWEIPLFLKEYAELYSVAYFQKGYPPRSYIEITFVHNLTTSFSVIAKWTNGGLPPLFTRVADLRIGLRLQ